MEYIGEEEKKELLEVIEAGYLFRYGSTDNPAFKAKVYRLEQEVARMAGVKHAVAVNSGTSALWVALTGLGIGPGDEVIVPGYTFVASMSSVIYARAVPILAEIDKRWKNKIVTARWGPEAFQKTELPSYIEKTELSRLKTYLKPLQSKILPSLPRNTIKISLFIKEKKNLHNKSDHRFGLPPLWNYGLR